MEKSEAEVVHLDHEKVAEAFGKGAVLLVKDNYKVHAGFRNKGGDPEIHARDTDIFYILDGEATFVIGGTVIEPITTAGETSGTAILGGESRRLVKGDVIVIPPTVPHWFKEVSTTISYFVVKVAS